MNSKKVKILTGEEIAIKLDSLGFFELTDKSELEQAKLEIVESKNRLNYFSGRMRKETLDFTDNRFFSIDCEELFETGGLTEYLEKVKQTFLMLNLKLDYTNEQSKQTENHWQHTIQLNGKEYIAFLGEFTDKDWGYAYLNFIQMLNDQLYTQGSKERFYPIRCDNGGEIVLLTREQFNVIKMNFPNDDDHPKKLSNWKQVNGL